MNIEDFDFFPSPFDLDDESELDNNQFWGYDSSRNQFVPDTNPFPIHNDLLHVQSPDSIDVLRDSIISATSSTNDKSLKMRSGPRIKKGYRPESKENARDKYDRYDFEFYSTSYRQLRILGYLTIYRNKVICLGDAFEKFAHSQRLTLTHRKKNYN
jgi:hypothetical protein